MNQIQNQDVFEKIFKEHLKIETYSKSIESLFGPRLLNKINYKPYYQRNYVWDKNKATYFLESILLGTEVPPLIFFDNNTDIEIIDGRQRFETIIRFMKNEFSLTSKGLYTLKQLGKSTYDDLAKLNGNIVESFLDAKIRIIEFKLVNEPPLDKYLEDKIKKEIFSRYNTGISPLKKSEIDNAVYDDDTLSNLFKNYLNSDKGFKYSIYSTFFKVKESQKDDPPVEMIMSFIRRFLVLYQFPITYFARGTGRTEILSKLYEYFSDSVEDENSVIAEFVKKVKFVEQIKIRSIKNGFSINRLALETFLWILGVAQLEEINIDYLDEQLHYEIASFINENIESYTEQDHAFQKQIITRYSKSADFITKKYNVDLSLYVNANEEGRDRIKQIREEKEDTVTKLTELETLRLNKPEPSRISIDDIHRIMQRRRFLVRPSYQRKEVINPTKASSIIESILLGITLPAIFVFKRTDGISEVIDGQQRILTLLGFIGAGYVDERGNTAFSKNHKFSLRSLKILKELDKFGFDELSDEQRDRILDFQLYIVEIDEKQSPNFDPIDLFIRLNDKPYPIRINSFEMWNSWVNVDIVQKIKDITFNNKSWFYVRRIKKPTDRDRMENEELLTAIAYLEYHTQIEDKTKRLDIYQKTDRINARISDKANISSILSLASKDEEVKTKFENCIKLVSSFIKKVKHVLLDQDVLNEEIDNFLEKELDVVFKGGKTEDYTRRTMQDFYLLWVMIAEINFEMIKEYRKEIKENITKIYFSAKNIPEELWYENKGYNYIVNEIVDLRDKYKTDNRGLKLTQEEKQKIIKEQGNISPISGTQIYFGDDIEVDHINPISKGGKDHISNLQIVHKDENRSKGSK